jgi:hypothetical protein
MQLHEGRVNMTSSTQADLVITPATWPDQAQRLVRTPTQLLDVVGWYGSTHPSAMWRKADEFLAVFRQEGAAGFDPQIDDWQPSFAATEAKVMATASVIVIRLENHELKNLSLGSIAEVGLALTSAALRGQIIIVSIENGLLTSLDEPGAIAQYMMLETFLDALEESKELARFFQIHRGDDLGELALLACQTAEVQRRAGQTGLDFNDFLAKKARRKQDKPLRILLGGSGGPYAEAHRDPFLGKKQGLVATYRAQGCLVKVLSEGALGQAWHIPYGSTDPLSAALAMRTLLTIEFEYKQEADILLLPIMTEAASKAAATEIGFLLLYALTTGQDIQVFLEPFDPVDYVRHKLESAELPEGMDEKQARRALQQAGLADKILATATQAEVFETLTLVKALAQGEGATFKQLKQSLLGKTEIFQNADNIRRVRTLVQAHLEQLHGDKQYPDFFSYSTQVPH